jgi:hypothetical protein
MSNIKHNKFKNSGILFELLVRQITNDTLSSKDSPAVDILKKYFVKSELGREYKLYDTLFKSTQLSETKANIIIEEVLKSSRKLNRTALKKEKYNLINEIKKHYNLEEFFKSKLPNYKSQASLYTLIEIYNTQDLVDPNQIISNKMTLLETLTTQPINETEVRENVLEEFKKYDKDLRILTYQVLLEKFNGKYGSLNDNQKLVLREFINAVDNNTRLREFYNAKVKDVKVQLTELNKNTLNKVTKIKLNEVISLITEIDKSSKISNDDIVNLLQYYSLVEELKIIK